MGTVSVIQDYMTEKEKNDISRLNELGLIQALLNKPSLVGHCCIEEKHFTTADYKNAYKTIKAVISEGQKLDNIALAVVDRMKKEKLLSDVIGFFNDVAGTGLLDASSRKESIEQYENTILTEYYKRKRIEGSACIVDDMQKGNISAVEGADKLKNLFADIEREENSYRKSDFDTLENTLADLVAGKSVEVWESGFPSLDSKLGGGFQAGSLSFIVAGTGAGKTSFALQIAYNVAEQDRPVIYFALEMSKLQLSAKIISRLTKEHFPDEACNTVSLLQNKLTEGQQGAKMAVIDTFNNSAGKRLFVESGDLGGYSVSELVKKIELFIAKAEQRPLVIVDYIQILSNVEGITDELASQKETVFRLKNLAIKYNLPVIAISATQKGSYDKGLTVGCVRGSGLQEFSADYVIGLMPEYLADNAGKIDETKVKQWKEQKASGWAVGVVAEILKGRFGGEERIYLDFYPHNNYYKERFFQSEVIANASIPL